MKFFRLIFILSVIYFTKLFPQLPQFEYKPVTTLSNDIASLSVYYFNPIDIDDSQIIALLKTKVPFDTSGFRIFLTSYFPAYRGTIIPEISYNYYKTDTLVFEPKISQDFYYDKSLDTLNVYLNIVKTNETQTKKDDSVTYLGPIGFIKVKKSTMGRTKNKRIVTFNKDFPVIKKYEKVDNNLFSIEAEYPAIGWAEYGTTKELGLITSPKLIDEDKDSGVQVFNIKTNELLSDTKYFWRYVILYQWNFVCANLDTVRTLPRNVIKKYLILPDTLNENSQHKVLFKISKKILQDFVNNYQIVKQYISSDIIIKSKKLKVVLLDPSGNQAFTITAITNEQQSLKDTLLTQWEWSIIPISSGKHKLALNISLENQGGLNDIPFPFASLELEVLPETAIIKIINFLRNNWQWFVGIIIAFVGIFPIIRKRESTPVQKVTN
jgi:hypothetical protein